MGLKAPKMHIGLRTVKTVAAVILSMVIVDFYGTSGSKLIFAMLGAMAAVQPTFQASLESCLTQIVGVLFGAVMGILLRALHLPPLVATGIGIVLVITLYNLAHITFSPSLPCFIVVMLCISSDIDPMEYALGRVWDTAIGLGVGMLINTLIFPYDNSRQIRATAQSLNSEVLRFLEDMFDGDDILPNADDMEARIRELEQQLSLFSKQRLVLKLRRQKEELAAFRLCEKKAKELVARLQILSLVEKPGRLNEENREKLRHCGASIRDAHTPEPGNELDTVTNYHVAQILRLRTELLESLEK